MNDPLPGTSGFVERLLADRIGLDVASVGEGLIARGVETRMNQLGVRRLEDYQRILLGPSDEVQALIEEVVIPESWFFRDDRPFAAFREFARSGWVVDPSRSPLSVLCLPCAGGEEPYSAVIALVELGLARERFEVVAVDVSERSIRRATAGIYGPNAFRGMNPDLQGRYFDFTAVRGRYLLKSSVRSSVRFEVGNLLDPTLLDKHAGFDVVFCRNLLIYFDESARAKAFSNLDRLTAADGLLFLGHADRADAAPSTRFAPLGDKGSFAYRKRTPNSSPTPASSPTAPSPPKPPAIAPKIRPSDTPGPRPEPPRPRRVDLQAAKSAPTPAARSDRDEVMTRALALADQGEYGEATRTVRDFLGRGSLDAPAHFLLGIIHQAAGDRPQAELEFGKAIYLDPDHDEALLALSLLARRKGDVAAEAMFRRRAERVLARKGRP